MHQIIDKLLDQIMVVSNMGCLNLFIAYFEQFYYFPQKMLYINLSLLTKLKWTTLAKPMIDGYQKHDSICETLWVLSLFYRDLR